MSVGVRLKHQLLYTEHRFNPLNADLSPIRHLLALVGARHIVHVSRVRVNVDTAVSPFYYTKKLQMRLTKVAAFLKLMLANVDNTIKGYFETTSY